MAGSDWTRLSPSVGGLSGIPSAATSGTAKRKRSEDIIRRIGGLSEWEWGINRVRGAWPRVREELEGE